MICGYSLYSTFLWLTRAVSSAQEFVTTSPTVLPSHLKLVMTDRHFVSGFTETLHLVIFPAKSSKAHRKNEIPIADPNNLQIVSSRFPGKNVLLIQSSVDYYLNTETEDALIDWVATLKAAMATALNRKFCSQMCDLNRATVTTRGGEWGGGGGGGLDFLIRETWTTIVKSSSYFLSFSIQKSKLPVSHRLMASTISVRGEPERVNLVVRALEPDYLLLDIFLRL